MKRAILIAMLILTAWFSHAEKMFLLQEPIKPRALVVAGDRLFVAGQKTIQQYSLKEKKFLRLIGSMGQGPREFDSDPKIYFQPPGKLLVLSYMKLMTFTLDGKFVQEKRFHTPISKIQPLGKNYVASVFNISRGARENTRITALCDTEFKPFNELNKQALPNARKRIDVVYFNIDFNVYKNKIFISKPTGRGFKFDVFDENGNPLDSIRKDFEQVEIPDEYISREMAEIKEEKKEYWQLLKDTLKFPKYFPALQAFTISGDRIYIKTWLGKGQEVKFIVMNLEGEILGNAYLPEAGRLYTIANNNYYYLQENIDREAWELHSANIPGK
jgi:hypothetical protein